MVAQIVIPSYGRADNLVGAEYFKPAGAKYVVPMSQRNAYESAVGRDRVIAINDSDDGAIAKKRNWILRNVPTPLVMIDDDVEAIGYFEGRDGTKDDGANKPKTMDPDAVLPWIEQGFELAAGFGSPVWGVAQNPDNRIYREQLPFNLSAVALGPFTAHAEHGLFYDERMNAKEDYDMALQALAAFGVLFRWNKYHYRGQHGDNPGGIVSMRTMEYEIAGCRAIENKWGRAVIKYPDDPKTMSDVLNARVNVPIRGV